MPTIEIAAERDVWRDRALKAEAEVERLRVGFRSIRDATVCQCTTLQDQGAICPHCLSVESLK